MRRSVSYVALLAVIMTCHTAWAAPIEVERSDEHILIHNGLWRLIMSKTQGWEITYLRDEKTDVELHGLFGQTLVRAKAFKVHDSGFQAEPTQGARSAESVAIDIQGAGTEQVVIERKWSLDVGNIVETTTFAADARSFDRRVVLEATKPVAELYAESRCTQKPISSRVIFLPEEERITGSTAGHPYMETYDPQTGIGFGFKPIAGITRLGRFAFGDPERGDDRHPLHTSRNYCGVMVYAPVLSYEPTPAQHVIEYTAYMSTKNERPFEVKWPDVELRKAWPKKMVARPAEGNLLDIAIRNRTDQRRPVHLLVTLRHGLDAQQTLVDKRFTLRSDMDNKLQYVINTEDMRFGVEVETRLTDLSNDQVQTKTEYFTVWPRYYRVSPLMGIHNCGGARGVLARSVPNERRGYVGVTEIYNWPRNSVFDMTPDTEWYLTGPYYFNSWSRQYLKDYIDACHESGMGVVSWAQGMVEICDAMNYPQYLQYTAKGQFLSDRHKIFQDGAAQTQGVLPPGVTENMAVGVNFNAPGLCRGWGQEMAASCRMFGWDGVRFDGPAPRFISGQPVDPLKWEEAASASGRDFDGKPLVYPAGTDVDAISLKRFKAWLEETRKGNPRFELGMNIGHGITRDADTAMENETIYDEWAKCLQYSGDNDAMWLHEGALGTTHANWRTWPTWTEKLMGLFRITQELGGVCTVGHIRWLPPALDRTRAYVAFSSGHRLAYVESDEHSYSTGDRFDAVEFAVRFGEFLFAPDHQLLPIDQDRVTVTGHERLHWNQFVRRRELTNGQTECVVHIVNLPEDDTIVAHKEMPAPRRNTTVQFTLDDGQDVEGTWVLLPKPPRAVPVEHRVEGNKVTVKIDEIDAFASVVCRTGNP